ncbi:MAG TPA: glycosyltransferase family A protein [Vitreimonas sp.]|uniref:glycosyltransferase family 2 protein n=1 Tax=Vitreimonas sp. TaxID=3069702 RepID=UPI002D61BA34|nr:glycosyltransferase family A protein [Vitreimonas sp.]HYD88943.1 glycosyltransferase family A protein [Vitreimonas sp.]
MDLLSAAHAQEPHGALVRTVSVIVPTRDRPNYLRQALASIRALEGPDLEIEILIGDNGACPQTQLIAEEFGARRVEAREGEGASVARNAALRAATGDYIAFLDDDDCWVATHLREHLDLLDIRPDLEAVMGQVISADHQLRRVGAAWPAEPPDDGDELLRRMLSGYFPQIGAVVARRGVREKIGGFDEKLIGGEDLDWLLRLARQHQLAVIPVESVLFRGRPLGVYDNLQLLRSRFDRKVFLRHALPEWRIWESPAHLWLAHYGTLKHFYRYFVDAAARRAARGERAGALKAIWFAFQVFPLRTLYHLFKWRRLRIAFLGAVLPRRSRGCAGVAGTLLAPAAELGEGGAIQMLMNAVALVHA